MLEKENNHIVLVNPNAKGNYVQGTFKREHLGLGYLSAELSRAGFEPLMVDSRLKSQTPAEAAKEILDHQPMMIGFSVIAKDATPWTEETLSIVKEKLPEVHIVLGNYFPSLQPKRAFESVPSADSIVMREGDLTFPELAECLATGKNWRGIKGISFRNSKGELVVNPRRDLVPNLNTLPFPIHSAGEYNLQEWAIEGSRGCYMRCTFCSIGPFFDLGGGNIKWRTRSPKHIVSEMLVNMKQHPEITTWRFVDPDFVGAQTQKHIERLRDFAQETLRLNGQAKYIIDTRTKVVNAIPDNVWLDLKRGGLSEVYLGIETATPYIKRMMQKGTTIEEDRFAIEKMERLGIRVRYGYMMITPWTTEDDVEYNARELRSLGFPRLDKYFQELFVVPGTKSVELTKSITDISFDNNGDGEYYTYGLPKAI
ncbi:MAG TPA: radical SAM protein, partial [Patescibacteria group bacterium]